MRRNPHIFPHYYLTSCFWCQVTFPHINSDRWTIADSLFLHIPLP